MLDRPRWSFWRQLTPKVNRTRGKIRTSPNLSSTTIAEATTTSADSTTIAENQSQISPNKQDPANLPPRSPLITDFSPKSAPIGALIKVSGNNFLNLNPVPPIVTLSQGNGSINAPVVSVNNTTIIFVIPTGATTGPIKVTVDKHTATSSQDLAIITSSTFSIAVGPTQLPIIQGQQASFSVTLNSNDGFDQLASLAVSGIPKGMSYAFSPAQITAGQTSILTLTAAPDQGLGVSPLTISASATIFGQQVVQTAMASVQVTGVSTSFIGRTVVDDAVRTPITGVTIKFLGVDGSGHDTGCSGQTTSDEGGNFSLTNLPGNCTGPQLVGYDGSTATKPPGKYAGVNLVYPLIANQVTTSPVLIHLPRIDTAETVQVTQNAPTDQIFTFSTIPGIRVTVYAGTTFKLADNSQPDPFPLTAINVPVDRLPDQMPPSGMTMPFIVAFQPANAVASQPVAVDFPNTLNMGAGTHTTLMTLDPRAAPWSHTARPRSQRTVHRLSLTLIRIVPDTSTVWFTSTGTELGSLHQISQTHHHLRLRAVPTRVHNHSWAGRPWHPRMAWDQSTFLRESTWSPTLISTSTASEVLSR